MTSFVKTSVVKSWLIALIIATISAQSSLAQTPGIAVEPQPAAEPAAAAEPAPAATTPAATAPAVQPAAPVGSDVTSDLMREQGKRMVDQFLLAIAVFFAVIAFLLFVSLPPRNASDQN